MNQVSEGQGGALIKYFQFSKKLVWLFLAASTFLLLYTYYRAEITWHGTQGEKYFKYYIISLTGVLFWSLVLWFKDEIRSNIVMATISFVAGIYLVEIILNFANVPPKNNRQEIAAEQGIKFDARSKLQVVRDFRDQGVDAFPSVNAATLLKTGGLHKEGAESLLPFGGVSRKKTVSCNEGGEYAIYNADRYGFNNPDSEWDQEQIEWLLTGDSFTQGACVQLGNGIAGQIRSLTGESVINLGVGGNGPLVELAILKEYA